VALFHALSATTPYHSQTVSHVNKTAFLSVHINGIYQLTIHPHQSTMREFVMKLKLKKLAAAVAVGIVASSALVAHAQNIDRDGIYTAKLSTSTRYNSLGDPIGTPKQLCDMIAKIDSDAPNSAFKYTTVDALVQDSYGTTGRALFCQFDGYNATNQYTHHYPLTRYAEATK